MSDKGRQHGTHAERLARVEAKIDSHADKMDTHASKMDENGKRVEAIQHDVTEIKIFLKGMQGFGRGMVFAASSFAALVGGTIATLWDKIIGGGGS